MSQFNVISVGAAITHNPNGAATRVEPVEAVQLTGTESIATALELARTNSNGRVVQPAGTVLTMNGVIVEDRSQLATGDLAFVNRDDLPVRLVTFKTFPGKIWRHFVSRTTTIQDAIDGSGITKPAADQKLRLNGDDAKLPVTELMTTVNELAIFKDVKGAL